MLDSAELDLLIGFMLFLVSYGAVLKIWEGSRTTVIVLFFVFLSLLLMRVGLEWLTYYSTMLFSFLLFIRATFRKRLQGKKLGELLYV